MSLDLNGDSDYLESNEMDDSRTFNKANELETRDVDTSGGVDYTLSHDAVGNLTDDDQYNAYVYDVWGRLRKVNNQTPEPISEYRYNGLNWRISMQHDDDSDGDLDSADKTYYFVYDERWRPVATFREDDSDPKEQFVYHAAGNDGRGSASYIDDVVLRDKDADTDWDVQADGTLEERLYYCQNWRHDVVGLVDASGGGEQVEQVRYEAYGIPTLILAGDVDASGKVDATDSSQIQSWIDAGTYDVRGDVDLDGDVDSTDKATVQNYTATKGGRTNLSHAEHANRKGYAGYEFDDTIAHESYHVRHRVLNSVLGQWGRQDPLGYADGFNLYTYSKNMPLVHFDSHGLECEGGRHNKLIIESDDSNGWCHVKCGMRPGFAVTSCKGGDLYICHCNNYTRDFVTHGNPDEPITPGQARAWGMIFDCSHEHEMVHKDQWDCLCDPIKGKWCGGENCGEMSAYAQTQLCLLRKCGHVPGGANLSCAGCNGDPECNAIMHTFSQAMFRNLLAYTYRCLTQE